VPAGASAETDGRLSAAQHLGGALDWDVVLLYGPPWSGPTRFSKHHLAQYLAARGARVLYVEAPLTPLGARRGAAFVDELRATLKAPHQVGERLWVRRHFLPVPYHGVTRLTSARSANRVGQRFLARRVVRDMQRMGLRQPIVIAGLPHAADAVAYLPKRALVYHCADDYASVRGFPSTLPEVEADLCRDADLVITTSETLCEARRAFNPQTYWVPNGADVEHFGSPAQPASELYGVPRPIIGFVGGLSEWVDLELVGRLARLRPEWWFVLIGPVGIDTGPVRELRNVRLLGPRPYAQLPSYLAAMDVGLIPFKDNDVTYHADPIKAYEYLAAGLPVVATAMPALQRLGHVVRLADSVDAFALQIGDALAAGRETGAAERRTEAANHAWRRRFDEIVGLIEGRLACTA
jgi:glycosyltransferase involved in cell wall biosynthesis